MPRDHPLATIRFIRLVGEGQDVQEEAIERYWYHVPRSGDSIGLMHRGERIEARVHGVFWDDEEGVVEVRLG